MPHIPDHTTHAGHDPALVAAHAAGDATGPDLAAATALVAGCAACAELHRDLRAIAAALPELPAPARPRDFRLTPEQAAALRPGGWRGVLAVLAGPRFSFAVPLGTGLATLGLAAILFGSLAGLPLGAGGAATSADGTRTTTEAGAEEMASAAPAVEDNLLVQGQPAPSPAPVEPPAAAAAPASPMDAEASGPADATTTSIDAGWDVGPRLAVIALAVGLALLALRLVAGRLARQR